MNLLGNAPGLSPMNLFSFSDNNGVFAFGNALPLSADYALTPLKNDNPLNGVTTYDLVLISKHILGLQPLNSPYKMIAADANASNSITTFDIVELRKLILGIYDELPTNTSWRFINESWQFADPSNPFAVPFPESIAKNSMTSNQMDDNFVAIKVGDVNSSAIPNTYAQSDDRSAGTLYLDTQQRMVEKGEVFDLEFRPDRQAEGYQFTLSMAGLELVDILPGPGMSEDNFALLTDPRGKNPGTYLTCSWNGNPPGVFSLRFMAKKEGQVSDMIRLSSLVTRAEAYAADAGAGAQLLDLQLRFASGSDMLSTGVGLELYQNIPNPWLSKTLIGFHLPPSPDGKLENEVSLHVVGADGRIVYSTSAQFPPGYNTFMLDRSEIHASGILYYRIETTQGQQTMKMIKVD